MADIWIEFHATRLIKLKKFDDLRKALQMGQYEVLGLLGRFWCEVLELREDGDISDWDADYFANLMVLKLSPERAWNALSNGWIDTTADGRNVVHDWLDCAGKYLTKKYKDTDRERLVKIWALHGRVYGEGKSYRSETEAETKRKRTLPDLTEPNLTIPNQTQPVSREDAFEHVWGKYPNKDGRKASLAHFMASVKVQSDFDAILAALENYLKSDKVKRGFIKDGKTWFNNWRDWVSPTESQLQGGANGVGKVRPYGGFNRGDNTAGQVDSQKLRDAGIPE